MPTSLKSGYQTESFGKISPENTANDYQDPSEQNMPLTFEHITSEGISGSDQMLFDPAFQESRYQPQDNTGYDYQEHMPFNPTSHESGSFCETHLENNGL